MSRPRKPFGHHQPGRLPSTMMKVLAAEMSDPGRLRRGKQYAKDGSVLDIIIEPGVVTCEVQGSRSTPYIASLEVTFGDGMPLRRDVHTSCTCPDDDNWDDHACKHAIATMFAFADELLIEPELLDVWRGHDVDETLDPTLDQTPDGGSDDADRAVDEAAGRGIDEVPGRRRHLHLVRDDADGARGGERAGAHHRDRPGDARDERGGPRDAHRDPGTAAVDDPIGRHLVPPEGSELPAIPRLERLDAVLPRRPELAAVLRDALANLRIDWD